MFFKYLLLDLDDTLYDYSYCHKKSIELVFNILSKHSNKSLETINEVYNLINENLKKEIGSTASSHNKTIYFKHLIEKLNIDLSLLITCEKEYWDTFYTNMKCYDGVLEFIKWIKKQNIKIAIITDYETEYQIKKLKILDILEYIDVIVTSEEIGKEKPSSYGFLLAIHKLEGKCEECIMIGDNYKKDIIGANHLNICSFWFNKENIVNKYSFISWKELHHNFINIDIELEKLEFISKYCGERFDLTQAGGGNTSVKYKDYMFIKASGYHLTQVSKKNGFVTIKNDSLKHDLENEELQKITNYNTNGSLRASIETYMHSILKKYTIHLHPIQINKILISKKCDEFIREFFPTSLLIDYDTPGINVCKKIMNTYNGEEVIFLKNHGIIITLDDYEKIIPILENTLVIFEQKLNINFDKYKYVNKISKHINNSYENISYLCQDKTIYDYLFHKKELFLEKITFPDALIFCGLKILFIDNLNEFQSYFETYNEYPKIIIINNLIYIINISLQKCKDTEDVLKGNLMILDNNMEKTYLTNEEICYLNNWDAEKYRKTI